VGAEDCGQRSEDSEQPTANSKQPSVFIYYGGQAGQAVRAVEGNLRLVDFPVIFH
jgi:hypothetical protein